MYVMVLHVNIMTG